MKEFAKFAIRLPGFFLLFVIFGFFQIQDWVVVNRIAAQFQITASWDAIRTHLADEEFKPGMTMEEVHKVLDKVGKWEIRLYDNPEYDPGGFDSDTNQYLFRENIRFIDRRIYNGLGSWGFLYDKSGKLVRQGFLDSGG